MKSDIRITHKREPHQKQAWKLSGQTVVKDMESTEMLFRIAVMAHGDFKSLVDNLSNNELRSIVLKIRAHRKEGQEVGLLEDGMPNVTKYVVHKYTTQVGLI